ncbi:MAG: ester cyclase [Vicinamibacterales bacterium]|jgi:predicted ester cyclase|nr:ester cyclase [Vicinamibacterales bacterium]
MERRAIADLILAFEAAMPGHDAKAQAEFHTANGVWQSPASGKVVGRTAIERNYRYWFEAFPDLMLDLQEMLIDGQSAVAFWVLKGRQEGPFFGLDGVGERVEVPIAMVLEFADDGIAFLQSFYDFSGLLLKTGALKVAEPKKP